MMPVFLALMSGVTIVLNRMLNAEAGVRLGLAPSTSINYLTGLIVSLLALLIVREPRVWPLPGGPLIYLGGAVGVVVVMLSSYAAPKLSVFLMTLLVFVSQFIAGLIIDAVTGIALSPLKTLGGALVLGGMVIYVLGEKDSAQV